MVMIMSNAKMETMVKIKTSEQTYSNLKFIESQSKSKMWRSKREIDTTSTSKRFLMPVQSYQPNNDDVCDS